MVIDNKKLINLKVETESGQEIGKVSNFEIDTGSQSVLNYKISPTNLLKEFIIGSNDLVVNRGQVIDITKDKMIVEDNIVKDNGKEEREKITHKKTAALPAMKVIEKE